MDSLTQTAPDIRTLIEQLLISVGENPSRAGLERTPERVEKAFQFMTKGYQEDVDDVLNGALFPIDYDEMVIVKDIDFYSLCEHHLLPFEGRAGGGVIPPSGVPAEAAHVEQCIDVLLSSVVVIPSSDVLVGDRGRRRLDID